MKFLLLFIFNLWALLGFSESLQLGGQRLEVELADSAEARKKGLMYRERLADGTGMLFVFEEPDILSFWMKNTLIPLSIAFFDEDRTLLNIEDMVPVQKGEKLTSFKSASLARYALEVPLGWFRKHKIVPGMKFSLLDPSKSIE